MTAFYKRAGGPYFTPAQVSLYLNNYLLDDACLIQYDVRDTRTPLWGYNDVLYRTVAVGQTVVQGRLSIKYRYEGYLMRVIQKARDRDAALPQDPSEISMMKRGSGLGLSDEVLQSSTAAVLDYLDASAEAGDPGTYLRASDFLKSRFWDKQDVNSLGQADYARSMMGDISADSQAEREERNRSEGYNRPWLAKPVDLRILHGQDSNISKPAFNRLIKGVVFDQQTYVADIDVPGGERVCSEVYSFIARNVEPVRIQRRQSS